MKEYIERETILKTPPFTKCVGDLSEYAEGYLDCVEDACEAVKKTPAADVEPVRHGKWVDMDSYADHDTPIYACSICYEQVYDKHIKAHKYCLHCGAKMDGGKSNEKN